MRVRGGHCVSIVLVCYAIHVGAVVLYPGVNWPEVKGNLLIEMMPGVYEAEKIPFLHSRSLDIHALATGVIVRSFIHDALVSLRSECDLETECSDILVSGLTFDGVKMEIAPASVPQLFRRIHFRDCKFMNTATAVDILRNNNVVFTRCEFANNGGPFSFGGAIRIESSVASASDCLFLNNTAREGAGVYAKESSLTFLRTTFRSNSAFGGIVIAMPHQQTLSMTVAFDDSILADNYDIRPTSDTQQGCLLSFRGQLSLRATNVLANKCSKDGLIAVLAGSLFDVSLSTFSLNVGSVFLFASVHLGAGPRAFRAAFSQTRFSENRALESGTAFLVQPLTEGSLTLTECRFDKNEAAVAGGVLHALAGSQVAVSVMDTMFVSNSATVGAVISLESASNMSFWRSNFTSNSATDKAGVLVTAPLAGAARNLEFHSTNFTSNFAGQGGAFFLADDCPLTKRVRFEGNKASVVGSWCLNSGNKLACDCLEAAATTTVTLVNQAEPIPHCTRGSAPVEVDGFSVCRVCPAGSVSVVDGVTACTSCSPGYYSSEEGLTSCTACPTTMAQPVAGSTTCVSCQVGSYSEHPGTPSCHLCPKNSENLHYDEHGVPKPRNNRHDCVCQGGYYGHPGEECLLCPPGGSCCDCVRENSTLNFGECFQSDPKTFESICVDPTNATRRRMWESWTQYNEQGVSHGNLCPPCFDSATGDAGKVWGTLRPIAGIGGYLVSNKKNSLDINAITCTPPEACTGGNLCAEGYMGFRCGECARAGVKGDVSYFRIEGLVCVPCGTVSRVGGFVMAIILAVLALLYIIWPTRGWFQPGAQHLIIDFLQTVGLFYSINVETQNGQVKSSFVHSMLGIISVSNLNADVFRFDLGCSFMNDRLQRFVLKMVAPVIALLVIMCFQGLYRLRARCANMDPVQSRILQSNATNAFLMVMMLGYTFMVETCLSMFACASPASADRTRHPGLFLVYEPSIPCSFENEEYTSRVIAAAIGLVVYGLGVPFLSWSIMWSNQKKRLLDDALFRRKFGWLAVPYVPKYYYWGVLLMVRKLAIMCFVHFLLAYRSWQVLGVFVVLFVSLQVSSDSQPFRHPPVNALNRLSLRATTILFCLVSIYLLSDGDHIVNAESFQTVVSVAFGLVFFSCLSFLVGGMASELLVFWAPVFIGDAPPNLFWRALAHPVFDYFFGTKQALEKHSHWAPQTIFENILSYIYHDKDKNAELSDVYRDRRWQIALIKHDLSCYFYVIIQNQSLIAKWKAAKGDFTKEQFVLDGIVKNLKLCRKKLKDLKAEAADEDLLSNRSEELRQFVYKGTELSNLFEYWWASCDSKRIEDALRKLCEHACHHSALHVVKTAINEDRFEDVMEGLPKYVHSPPSPAPNSASSKSQQSPGQDASPRWPEPAQQAVAPSSEPVQSVTSGEPPLPTEDEATAPPVTLPEGGSTLDLPTAPCASLAPHAHLSTPPVSGDGRASPALATPPLSGDRQATPPFSGDRQVSPSLATPPLSGDRQASPAIPLSGDRQASPVIPLSGDRQASPSQMPNTDAADAVVGTPELDIAPWHDLSACDVADMPDIGLDSDRSGD